MAYTLLPEAQKQVYDKKLQRKAMKKSASSVITKYATGAAVIGATPIKLCYIWLPNPFVHLGQIRQRS